MQLFMFMFLFFFLQVVAPCEPRYEAAVFTNTGATVPAALVYGDPIWCWLNGLWTHNM